MSWLILSMIAWAQAEMCDVRTETPSPIQSRSFVLELDSQKELRVIGSLDMTQQDRVNLMNLFWNKQNEEEEALFERGKVFLQRYADAIAQEEENLSFLKQRLEINREYFVALEGSKESIEKWQEITNELYLQAFEYSNNRPVETAAGWQKLLLLAIGAPLYLRANEPALLGEDEVRAVDTAAATISSDNLAKATEESPAEEAEAEAENTHAAELEQARKNANEATQKMLRSLASNPKTLRAFKRFVPQVAPGSKFLRGKSEARVRDYVLDRTWAPAKSKTRAWLDAQFAYIRASEKPAPKPAPAPKKPEHPPAGMTNVSVKALFEQVRAFGDNGVIFVPHPFLLPYSKALQMGCEISRAGTSAR